MEKDFDYGIIGGGPAGYTAGLNLAKQGFKVAIFEKDKIGGTCLNRGCIPTKVFLHLSEEYKKALSMEKYGININATGFDFSKVVEAKNNIVEKLRKNLEFVIKRAGIEVISEYAEIKSQNIIKTKEKEYSVENIIWAAGSKPKEIKGLPFDKDFVLDSDDILNLNKLPKEVVIVGSGAIGTEWARIFNNFGVVVNIVELAEHLLPVSDIEVSKRIERIFKQNGINIFLKDYIQKIENKKVVLNSGKELNPDFVLIAIGRESLTPDIEIENILGDSKGEIQLAHYAISMAREFVCGIKCNKNLIPSVIYGEPEIAWVGLREQDCDETYTKKLMPISALGKAWCDESTEGFIKLITKDNLICGAHIISKEASSLIQQMVIAMQNNISLDNLKEICYAHPTYSEGIGEIVCNLF